MIRHRLVHGVWAALGLRHHRALAHALHDPAAAQERRLLRTLRREAESEFGREHGFGAIAGVREFRRRVPVQAYDELAPWIERVRAGHRGVLTRAPVRRLVPTSGSSGSRKLIPWTGALRREFDAAIGAWTVDLFRSDPELGGGPGYWSISPLEAAPEPGEADRGPAPVGFDEDSAYLGGVLGPLVASTLAVPGTVRHVREVEAFRYATLRFLMQEPELRLVSVWHPSFLTLLLSALERHIEPLLEDLARGTLGPPEPLPPRLARALARRLRAMPERARELARATPRDAMALWPRLRLVSCWADARAADALGELRARLPGVRIQPKGLLATEGFVSLPFQGTRPAAVTSHFLELVDDAGDARLVHEVERGGEYRVLLTTGGGLYRYDLRDRVEVTGFLGRTPSLRFLGREDRGSDLCGEKLTDAFAGRVIERLLEDVADVRFAMLAPDREGGVPAYTLYVECGADPSSALAERLDLLLSGNPHYALARRLGQLAPPRLFRVHEPAAERYLGACRAGNRRLGDIKPAALDPGDGWSGVFQGGHLANPGRGEASSP